MRNTGEGICGYRFRLISMARGVASPLQPIFLSFFSLSLSFFFVLPPVERYLYAAVECKYSYARVRVFLAHRV